MKKSMQKKVILSKDIWNLKHENFFNSSLIEYFIKYCYKNYKEFSSYNIILFNVNNIILT